MHPADAAARGLGDGELVEIVSRAGASARPLEVSDEMMPGWSACRTAGATTGRAPGSRSPARTPARASTT